MLAKISNGMASFPLGFWLKQAYPHTLAQEKANHVVPCVPLSNEKRLGASLAI
jgi:hypothetical protein